jgi:hypothetical protein
MELSVCVLFNGAVSNSNSVASTDQIIVNYKGWVRNRSWSNLRYLFKIFMRRGSWGTRWHSCKICTICEISKF